MNMHPVALDLADVSNEALVKSAKAGNDRAFEELVRRSWAQSLHLALGHLGDYEDAVDELQSAYWRAYSHLHTFAEKAQFSTWVGRIVINGCIVRLRRSSRRAKIVSFDLFPDIQEGPSFQDRHRWSDPEEEIGSRQVSDLVRHELRYIPRLMRTAVQLHHLQGMSLEEVAVLLNISVGAVKTRVSRGTHYLRARMTRHLGQKGVASLIY
jgi:RNA polymerase sigma-70 factor, ECF subfamily